ncbi:hypothetical protein AN639_03865 [Candidatus Epulonipiscium fishelsonii]|uniref:Uncharacterized protein n=1 Tax=Candidatus Epulonipiscium fishelsonii TaxID=77094 RepID=A0ACC8XAS2_9FIRM|nr:hypothetical protein AN396_08515 [Epulopiscium sp. SCG-B11WGA-EpuloA1]ONI41197.1 hypothetical protein AN639_03865 [Epulopiscium sp. SCG-B05WGA-EpuloA1]
MDNEELLEIEKKIHPSILAAVDEALDNKETEVNRKKSQAEILMNYINEQNRLEKIVQHSFLMFNVPEGINKEDIVTLLNEKDEYTELKNLSVIQMGKHVFYYNNKMFTERFATVQALIESKDILAAIATCVRHDCKVYPRPVQVSTLQKVPYRYTLDEILGAIARMRFEEEYADIDTVKASNGNICIYSKNHMNERYAQFLAEQLEVTWMEMQ